MKIFNLFHGWLDSDNPKHAEILDKIKADVKAAQDLAEAHRKIDADADEKRRKLHAETEAKKAALGISSGPPTEDPTPFLVQPVEQTHEVKPPVMGADPKQVAVPVAVPVIVGKGK